MRNLTYRLFFITLFILSAIPIYSNAKRYNTEIHDPDFASLYVIKNNQWDSEPIVTLNSSETLEIFFDCLSDDIPDNLYYKAKFCNYDWTLNSTLFESEYINGINNQTINLYDNSINTTTPYANYSFSFPNTNLYPKLPGNYILEVFDEDKDDEVILTIQVYVIAENVKINSYLSNNTFLGNNNHHQQLDLEISYNNQPTNPSEDYKVIVKQNNRSDNMVIFPRPNFFEKNRLIFKNNQSLTFEAGNEYLRFDTSSGQLGGIGIANVEFFDQQYHFYLDGKTMNIPSSYHYDETQQGKVIYRRRDNKNVNNEGDYFWVHFTLKTDKKIPKNEIFLNGDFTYQSLSPKYILDYDSTSDSYQKNLLLKQGLYNYQYLIRDDSGKLCNLQGDFYQTKNSYNIYVYFFDKMNRSDQLVGYKKI